MEYLPIIFFAVVLIFLLMGFPVAFTLGGVSFIFGVFTFGFNFFNLLPLRVWGIMSNYVLLAVPLFIFMGVMLERSGIAEELLETMALAFRKVEREGSLFRFSLSALCSARPPVLSAPRL